MVSFLIAVSLLGTQGVQGASGPGPYPVQFNGADVVSLAQGNIVAIVEPVSRADNQRRSGYSGPVMVDTFRVVDGQGIKAPSTLVAVVPQPTAMGETKPGGKFASKFYLIFGMGPKDGKLSFPALFTTAKRTGPDFTANANEISGFALIPTTSTKLIRDSDPSRTFLRCAADAFGRAAPQFVYPTALDLQRIRYAPSDRFGTLSARDWFILFVSGDMHRALVGAPISHQMLALILDVQWLVPGSVESLLNLAPAAEKDLDEQARHTWQEMLGRVDPSWARLQSDGLVKYFFDLKSKPARLFVLRAITQVPTKRAYGKLLDAFTDPDLEIRIAVLDRLAVLANLPEKRPVWVDPQSHTRIKDEAQLITFWNRRG